MNTKKAKQQVTLAMDVLAMQGPFTLRAVAEEALRGTEFQDLSLLDQREMLVNFYLGEARLQAKAPLGQEIREEYFKRLPDQYWPIVEKLSRTICTGQNQGKSYHVYTLYATRDDWAAFLGLVDSMAQRIRTARTTGRDIRDLLQSQGVATLHELLTGEKPHITTE